MAVPKSKKNSRKPLNKDRILAISLQIADEEGIESLSMRNIANRLGVKAMSLYKHITNKDEVLDGLIDLVVAEIEIPSLPMSWKDFMKKRARSARAVFLKHSWAPAVFESRLQFSPARLQYANSILGKLRQAGYSITKSSHIFMVVDSYIYGFIIQERNWNLDSKTDLNDFVTDDSQTGMEDFPYILELMEQIYLTQKKGKKKLIDLDSEFESGLEAILTAYEKID